jgi:hypothetical protein
MTNDEVRALVRRCEALGRCPLGAAADVRSYVFGRPLKKPYPVPAAEALDIETIDASLIADDWDGAKTGRPAHVRSMRRAIAAGLGPRIVAGLERLEKGGSDG